MLHLQMYYLCSSAIPVNSVKTILNLYYCPNSILLFLYCKTYSIVLTVFLVCYVLIFQQYWSVVFYYSSNASINRSYYFIIESGNTKGIILESSRQTYCARGRTWSPQQGSPLQEDSNAPRGPGQTQPLLILGTAVDGGHYDIMKAGRGRQFFSPSPGNDIISASREQAEKRRDPRR